MSRSRCNKNRFGQSVNRAAIQGEKLKTHRVIGITYSRNTVEKSRQQQAITVSFLAEILNQPEQVRMATPKKIYCWTQKSRYSQKVKIKLTLGSPEELQ